ncbi:hypothetical protein STCU_04268 [Strigomonas culicis]|nr:hypothetical protein STCU_04268 [Strigomonas culicis]|eukprot:EPY30036.1 hypothetical protein STCU_04268 [Strigomonas culicis]
MLHVFLDMDLQVLGGEPERYAQYADQIRQEYEPVVGADAYNTNRCLFLSSFLERPMWFKTPYFFYTYEQRARENVKRERETLAAAAKAVRS